MQSIYSTDCSFSFAHVFFGSGGQDIAFTPPPDRPIRAGDIGVLDLGVVYEGYGTDYARMAQVEGRGEGRRHPPVGTGIEGLRKIFPSILAARNIVESVLKPGIRASDVFLAGAKRLEEDGLCASISDVGHGIGLECHERPFLTPYSDDVIAVGQTIVIEIYCEVQGIGPVLLEDGGLVTSEGWQSFSNLSTDLITVPS
jgi:Xaa-Pro aminopeptidase